MVNLKADVINEAYSRMKISGITIIPGARENRLALGRLEKLAASLKERGKCVGYNFEDRPDINSSSGIPLQHQSAYELLLAQDLLGDYGKELTQNLMMRLNASMSTLTAATATPRMTQYPARMPRGRGNRRFNNSRQFYTPVERAPNTCYVNQMIIGDINDFTENFSSYLLDTEDVSSYTISADTGLTIVSDSLETPVINYRISADGGTSEEGSPVLKVTIVATTDSGRVETRVIDFTLSVA